MPFFVLTCPAANCPPGPLTAKISLKIWRVCRQCPFLSETFRDYFYIIALIIVEIPLPLYIRLCHLYGYFCFFSGEKNREGKQRTNFEKFTDS